MKKNDKVCTSAYRSACPVTMALDVVGDKWSLLILRDLMFSDKRSYGELQSSDEGIATNILAARLAKLMDEGIIYKVADNTNARRSQYFLTDKGIGLLPVIMELREWTAQWHKGGEACEANEAVKFVNKPQQIKRMTKDLKKKHLQIK